MPRSPWYRKKEMVPEDRHRAVTMPMSKKTGTTISDSRP